MKKFYAQFAVVILITLCALPALNAQVNESNSGSYTSTVPANAVSATVEIWGAGGAGGGGTSNNNAGSGGGGGAYSARTFAVLPGQIINYTIGSGGNGSTGNGGNGGNTTLSHTITGTNMTANGGTGGTRNNNPVGVGGTATGGTTNMSGQNGGNGGGNTGGNGGNAGNTTNTGGAGQRNDDGNPGTIPGGGGGGGEDAGFFGGGDQDGGDGANGRVIITYTIVLTPTILTYTPNPVCVGQSVTITGNNFNNASAVRFNGVNATSYTVNNNTQITAVVPATTNGTISIVTPGGTATSATNIVINSLSTTPTSINGTNSICNGNSTTLARVGGSAGSGATLQWFSGSCGGTSVGTGNSINVSPTTTTTYFVRYSGTCNTTSCAQITVTVENPVAAAGIISGAATVCQGQNSVSYSVPSIANATSYNWSLPTGASIVSGVNTNNITVNFNASATSGNVSVFGSNSCGNGAASSLPVTVDNLPNIAGTITGNASVCPGDTGVTFSIPTIVNASSYAWSVPTGATITSGADTDTITVDFSLSASSGTISVYGINSCGNGVAANLSLTVNPLPDAAGTISGPATVCPSDSGVAFSVPIIANATGYSWNLPAGATIASGTNTNSITVDFSASPSSGIITVQGTNACGVGTMSANFTLTINIESIAPTNILGTTTICETASTTLTLNGGLAGTGATAEWFSGSCGGTSEGTGTSITISPVTTTTYFVRYSGTCNVTNCAQVTVNVDPLPLSAGNITGPSAVCQGQSGVTFTVPVIANATDYIWTLPTGATIASGANTNSIVVDFDVTATSGVITVQGSNACGVGAVSANFAITVNITPFIQTNYSIDTCSGILATLTPTNGSGDIIPAGTTYSWGLPTVTGGITGATAMTGQSNFNQTLVNPTNSSQTASYSVTASTAGCSASTFTVVVTVNPSPVGSASPATQTVCPGVGIATINLTEISGVAGTIDYSWTRDNTSNVGGMGASGTGNTITGNLTNTTSTAQTTIYTITASSQYGCESNTFTASITVSPTPTFTATPATQTICSENNITNINLNNTNSISGTTYSWTRTNTSNITGIPDGSGTTISGALTNTTNIAQTTVFTITAFANGCPSSTQTVSVTVSPKPTISATPATQTVCGDVPITNIVATNPNSVSGVSYSWSRDNTTNLTGIPNSGTGATISGTFVNNTNTNQTAVFTIRATSGSCFEETTVEVIVRPTPLVVATPATQTLCNGTNITPIVLSNSNNVPGTTYSWTRNNTTLVTGIAASGSGTSISGNLVNTTTTTQTIIFTITATAGGCSRTTTAAVTMYSPLIAPVIADSQDVCNFQTPSSLFMSTLVSGGSNSYTYRWERSNNGTTGWVNAPGASTNTTYNPPNNEGYYRLRVTDANCGTIVYSNVVVINYIGLGGVFDSISASNLPGTVCSGTLINPGVNIEHSLASTVTFNYSATSAYVNPSSGTITNPTVTPITFFGLHYADRTSANIPLTAQNNTNATVTTLLYVAPIFNNGFGTCTADAIAIPITIRPVPIADATIPNVTICSGTSGDIAVTGNITDASMQFSWVRNTPGGITGTTSGTSGNITPGGTYTINNPLTNTNSAPVNVTYTITPRSNGCNGTPITIVVTVAPNVTPGAVANNQILCSGGDPAIFTQSTAATGLNLTYQWQVSTVAATGPWTDISGATGTTYDAPGPLTQTTWYRRIAFSTVNGVTCASAPSAVITVTINNIAPGSISRDQTVCSPGDPAVINSDVAASGLGTRTYQWQLNTVGCGEPDGAWTPISGATSASYNPPAGLLITTYYRRVATFSSGGCSVASNCVTVFVNDVTAGTIGNDQTICGNNPDAFTVITASTATGTLTYQWQSSTNNVTFTDISGATSATYDAPPGVTVTTYYRRITISTLNGVSCTALSNIVTVTANVVTPGVIATNRTVCSGDDPAAFIITTPATGTGLTYQWQSASAPAGPYTDISGATSAIYDVPGGITVTTYYRRVVTGTGSGTGCSVISNFVTVFVNDISPSTIAGDQTICSTDDPTAFIVSSSASGTGTLSYQWQSSATSASGPWTNINLATGPTYDPPVLAQTTYYQVVVTSTLNGVACTDDSNVVTVTVSPYLAPVASNLTTIGNCNDTTIQLSGNSAGQWSAVSVPSGNSFSFSNTTDPNATFSGESGATYDITWTIDNPSPCADDAASFQVVFPDCGNFIDFDGNNDYINVSDRYDLSGAFSIELWLKRDTNTTGTETLLSKRDANNLASGYDLSIVNGRVSFRYNSSGLIQSPQTLNNSRWFHVALTFNAGTYRLYIDGVEVISTSGPAPAANAFNYLIGANGRLNMAPQDHFDGSLDEIKIWNTALTESQIRETMNQEIEISGANVRGSVLGMDVAGLNWSNLLGYYQMNQSSDINSGQLADDSSANNVGALQNMTTLQAETAPVPYMSDQNGNWSTPSTWLNGNVQLIPNGLGVDG
ncbi:MAG: PKD-like domain-containing protein, partial [Aquaticitalea sp.]